MYFSYCRVSFFLEEMCHFFTKMATAKARQLAAKKKELQNLEEEIKATKNLAYKVLNSATEYKSSSGMTLKEMKAELKKIHEVLGIEVNEGEKDPSISVFKELVNEKFSKQDELDQQVSDLREQISAYEKKIKQIQIPKEEKVNVDSLPEVEGYEKSLKGEKSDLLSKMGEYKDEFEKLRLMLDKFKFDLNLTMKAILDRFKNEKEAIAKEYLAKKEAQENELEKLKAKAKELQNQLKDVENSKSQYSGETNTGGKLPDEKAVEKECQNIISQYYDVLEKAKKRLDTFEKTSEQYKGFILKLDAKIPSLMAQIARVMEKVQKLIALIRSNKGKAGKITQAQVFQLMHCFLKSAFLYHKSNEVTHGIEDAFAAEAEKIKKRLEIEQQLKSKKVYEDMTLSDLRKEIIRLIKENARLNLEMEKENKEMGVANELLDKISKTE